MGNILPYSWMIHIRAWRFLKWGEPEIQWLDRLVDPSKTALDIGANLGLYSYFLRKYAREVHCWEPNPELQKILQSAFGDSLKLHPYGLSSEEGTATLSFPILDGVQYHGWGSLEKEFPEHSQVISHQVPLKTLDTVELPPVGFIKIDVEGHELSVLKGAMQILSNDHPKLLIEIEEQHAGSQVQETFKLLESLGYQASHLQNGQFTPLHPDEAGKYHLPADVIMILFIHKEELIPE